MKNGFCKRIVAVVLTLCMTIYMVAMSTTTAYAENRIVSGLKDAGVDKLIELGVRGLCELTLGLSESMNEDAQESVESICSWILMDASEAAIVKVQETCDEILKELYVIEDKLIDYTVDISSDLAKQTITKAKENYQNQWTKDVVNVMTSKNDNMGKVYNDYLYYFILSNLLANGYPETEDEISALNDYLGSLNLSISKSDVTQKNVESAKATVDKSFELLVDDSLTDKQKVLYTDKKVNKIFVDTIKALSDKLERVGYETQGEPNVLDRAATYAYFALPYSEQQYEFISGTAQKQSMIIAMLELAYGEFLANQGAYLEENNPDVENWADEELIAYGDNKVSYNSLKDEFFGNDGSDSCVLYAFDKIANMYSSSINIDASSYTGDYNDQVTYMGKYFKPEDAKSVELTISSFKNEYDYEDDSTIEYLCNGLKCSGLVTKANRFTSAKVRFNRIVPGNNSSQVYYILDDSYYGELKLSSLYNKIKREGPLGGSDGVYGDFHVASMDYINLMKEMSDGTNTYKCPDDLNASLTNLNKTVAFAAAYGYVPSKYYSRYLPVNTSSQTFRLLENDYYLDLNLNIGDGPYMVRDADADFANLNKNTDTDYKFNISNVNFSGIAGSSDLYTVIVANTSGDYKQKVSLDYKSDCAQLSLVDGSNTITSTGTVKSGNDITLKIKLEDGNVLKSLKCIRKNAETTQNVLIDEGESEYFYNEETDCYEFKYNMPYSEVEFVLETERGIPTDSEGNFVVRTYDDLLAIAENVNNGKSEYVNGDYILNNDITVPENEYWNTPIGTPSSKFSGTFDGQGYKIIGLKSNMPAFYEPDSIVNQSNMGLFGYVRDAQFENLYLENVNFSFDDEEYSVSYVGAICARAEGDNTFSKCIVSGSMNFNRASEVGGVVGVALAGKNNITNCANHIDFTISSCYCCGGIAGSCDSGVTITNCYTVGDFNGSFSSCTVIKGSGGKTNNCYVLDNTNFKTYSGTTECTLEQFKSGEVCYLLNSTSTIPNYVWFQSIDNGETPDDYPTLGFAENKVVFKVDKENKKYSNTPQGKLLGDTDLDTEITIMDATLIQHHCAMLYELTGIALVNGDINKDQVISITDATRIQAHIADIMPIE